MQDSFDERKKKLSFFESLRKKKKPLVTKEVACDLFTQCPNCQQTIQTNDLIAHFNVCPLCNHHLPMNAKSRINMIVDNYRFRELKSQMKFKNHLHFPEYDKKHKNTQEKTGLNEAVVTGIGYIHEVKYMIIVMDNQFFMGSMGSIVGEKIAYAIEYATKLKLPLFITSTSGGARMQEGIYSLLQMSKVSMVLARHSQAGLFHISLLTHPTMGGVSASFAMLGDVVLAEPNALIGFAGPRVIEQTINEKLPEGFQRSEYLLEHGFIDQIVERKEMRETLKTLTHLYCGVKK